MLKYLFFLTLLSLILGPAFSFPQNFPGVNIYISDILIGLNALFWIINLPISIKIFKKDRSIRLFLIFIIISIFSLILSPIRITTSEKIISSLYVIRLLAYFAVYLTTSYLLKEKLIKKDIIIRSLITAGIILSSFGWLQYFLYPDLRNIFYMGWDPHYKRIFSTFLDPNFFGLLLVLNIIVLLTTLYFSIYPTIFTFITLLFTYSRSSFLSFILSITYYYLSIRKYLAVSSIWIILAVGILLLPRPAGEGVKLERIFSLEERITSMKQGLKIFYDHPFLGVGFNTLRYAKKEYGFLSSDWQAIHSGAGIENSFIFIAATTGIWGLIVYIFFLIKIFLKSSILGKTTLIAIIIHSLFLNSLFFPPIMIWFWIVNAIEYK